MKDKKEKQKPKNTRMDQARHISALASRLPWIVLAISLFAFLLIFLQALFA